MYSIRFEHVTFTHSNASVPLFQDLTFHAALGWTGIVGPNGSGKTTLLALAQETLEPQSGAVFRQGRAVFCPQRTDDPPEGWEEFLVASDADAGRLRAILEIRDDWLGRWETLSHGERKRSQIAVALWLDPAILLIDEPTNHLDHQAMRVVRTALSFYRGTGLLVSHDRDLLDSLCQSCLFLEPPKVRLVPGNYTAACQQRDLEDRSREQERSDLEQEIRRLSLEVAARRHEASAADKKKSKRHLDRHDSDGRGRIGLAIVTGKDGVAGKLTRQLQSRVQKKQQELATCEVKIKYKSHYRLPGAVSPRNTLLRTPPGQLSMGEGRRLTFPEMIMGPTDRIALVGPNGAGKSLFLRHILSSANVPPERMVVVPQEISMEESRGIIADLKGRDKKEMGTIFSIISCLGSRPDRLLESDRASPGEIRKTLLALGIAREPYLIVMDEPTNHLDLLAIELLEGALSQCPCGILLVSHDRRFLQALTTKTWRITPGESENRLEPE